VLRRLFFDYLGRGGDYQLPFDPTAPPSSKVQKYGVTNAFQRFSPSTCTVKLENELYGLETTNLNAFIYQEEEKKAKYVVLIHHFRK